MHAAAHEVRLNKPDLEASLIFVNMHSVSVCDGSSALTNVVPMPRWRFEGDTASQCRRPTVESTLSFQANTVAIALLLVVSKHATGRV